MPSGPVQLLPRKGKCARQRRSAADGASIGLAVDVDAAGAYVAEGGEGPTHAVVRPPKVAGANIGEDDREEARQCGATGHLGPESTP